MNYLKNVIDTVNDGLRRTSPPFVRSFLDNYGNIPIKNITICKKPIQKTFDAVINIISMGQWKTAKENLNYDNLYHLFMILELVEGTIILLEKNQVINIELKDEYIPDEQTKCVSVEYIPSSKTINNLINNAVEKYGENRIFLYDGTFANCQRFLTDLLVASDIIKPTKQYEALERSPSGFIPTSHFGIIGKENNSDRVYQFINQDTITLFNQMPQITGKIVRGVTDIATIFDRILYGTGKHLGGKSEIQAVIFDNDSWTPIKARKWLKSKDLQPIKKVHDISPEQFSYRICDPDNFDNFITKDTNKGIQLIIGFF